MSLQEEYLNVFKPPIAYLENKQDINKNIVDDLELVEYKDDKNKNLYGTVLNPQTNYGNKSLINWSKYYTTDKIFLKESQELYKRYNKSLSPYNINKLQEIESIWYDITDDDNFKHNYHYVEYNFAEILNESSLFLEILTLYNLSSPVLSLLTPIIFFILPFFILKFKGINITMEKYVEVLQTIISRHAIGQIFSLTDSEVSWEKRIYIVISILFYFYQIYQNVLCCSNFYNRMYQMHEYIFNIKDFIDYNLLKMDDFLEKSNKLSSYQKFNNEIVLHKNNLIKLRNEIEWITPFSHNITKLLEIGNTMTIFYNLHVNNDYNNAMLFSMGFIGYIDNISAIHSLYKNKHIAMCKFSNKKTKFKNAYYAPFYNSNPVKNSYSLKNNIIITGPNAAGKTTMLKTTLFNIIFSQQTGCGFYEKCDIQLFDHLHCYLNIPDTSGRDSLFQAEARRCKNILDSIINSKQNERHFCIFDELYSGTNPYEAISSSYSLLEYLSNKNCKFLLTTHFLDLCEKINNNNNIKNYHMKITSNNDGSFKYTYKLDSGISSIKGGIKVLEDLNYPDIIIKKAEKDLDN